MTARLVFVMLVALPMVAHGQSGPRPDADPRVEKIVAAVSEQRLRELLTKLVSFGTRNTLSDQTSTTRGIGAARNWILEEMRRSSEKLRVNFDSHGAAGEMDVSVTVAAMDGRRPDGA